MSNIMVEGSVVYEGGGGGVGGDKRSTSSSVNLSSPLSEPEQSQQRPLPSYSSSSSHTGENKTGPSTTSIAKPHGLGVEHYSLTPPPTTLPATSHTSTTKPQDHQPQLLQPTTAGEKARSKRPRNKVGGADVETDQKEKTTRKKIAGTKSAAAPVRKKVKSDNSATAAASDGQSKISDFQSSIPTNASITNGQSTTIPATTADYPIRNHDAHKVDVHVNMLTSQPSSPPPAPRMSYDPVRSMMVQTASTPPKVYSTAPPNTSTLSELGRSAPSASPTPASHSLDASVKSDVCQGPSRRDVSSGHLAREPRMAKDAPPPSPPEKSNSNLSWSKPANQAKKASSSTHSNAPSPKPHRIKEQPPPLPQGSGLISSALFGSTGNDVATSSEQAPNIYVHVKLKNPDNNIINFARLAEEKYGFAALHPRLAAQKARLARVAAASAALEKSAGGTKLAGDSGDDDLSVDVDRESDNDGDLAMTGVNGGGTGPNSGAEGAGAKKRRKKKVEEYDQDDPFVDDSELAWEAQAAAVKDGFFVWCGRLVPEGEKPAVERPDGTVKRGRGRGRGGGPGSRGGRGAAAAPTGSATSNGEGSIGRGGGPGSRGGATTRKPRVTKAGRATLDREKQEREKMAPLAAKPSGYPAP